MKKIFLSLLLFSLLNCDVLPAGSVYRSIPGFPGKTSSSSANESAEFKSLMENDQINKKRVTAEVLTYLLNDPDPSEKRTATVIENASNCNIIVRVVGINNNQIYNLPIARQSKNQFVIDKGNYTLKSNICGANYYSQKNVSEPLILKLANN